MNKKYRLLIVVFGALFASTSFASGLTYKGFTPRETTLDEIVRVEGKPVRITRFNRVIHYWYPDAKYSASDLTKVMYTVAVFDPSFTDINGLSVGDDVSKFEKKFETEVNDPYFSDSANMIHYWFDQGKIEKIVLTE